MSQGSSGKVRNDMHAGYSVTLKCRPQGQRCLAHSMTLFLTLCVTVSKSLNFLICKMGMMASAS